MSVTIIGASGFIGSHLVHKLRAAGYDCYTPARNDELLYHKKHGAIIYCAGITSDFRSRPFDTIDAHVSTLAKVIKECDFQSLIYLSSTRIYIHNESATETEDIKVNPNNKEDIFNISKLLGESLCKNNSDKNIKILRISNVLGNDFNSNNFVYSLIKDAVDKKRIVLNSTLDSEKDYVSIEDVTDLIIKILKGSKSNIYNLASGINISNEKIVSTIIKVTGCDVVLNNVVNTIKFPLIDNKLIREEFDYKPCDCLQLIEGLAQKYMEDKDY